MLRFLVLLVFIFTPSHAMASALDWANGNWALDPDMASQEELESYNCDKNPMNINVDIEKNLYVAQGSGGSEKAKIMFTADTFFKIQYEGEERLMDDGSPHIWIMVFVDKDHFMWVREDWIKDGKIKGSTTMRVRCNKLEVS